MKADLSGLSLHEIYRMGFPYPEIDEEKILRLFHRLAELDVNELMDGKIIRKTEDYSSIATVFFPHIWETKVTGRKSPVEAFYDVKLLTKAIDLSLRFEGKATISAIRSKLKIVSGTQRVSNFRPEVAKLIYERYGNRGSVFDFSMGYGGRIVGFLASSCREYVGTDVNTRNYPCYSKLLQHLPHEGKRVLLFRCPSESFNPKVSALEYVDGRFEERGLAEFKEYFDLSFSSPPYYKKEIYSDDPDQSHNRYHTYRSWLFNYLLKTIRNCIEMTKDGGYIVVNIADVKINNKVYHLEHDLVTLCKMEGLVLEDTLRMQMVGTMGAKKGWREEPIFVFRKA